MAAIEYVDMPEPLGIFAGELFKRGLEYLEALEILAQQTDRSYMPVIFCSRTPSNCCSNHFWRLMVLRRGLFVMNSAISCQKLWTYVRRILSHMSII